MGVRGTDFVFGVEEAAGKINLHTMDGLVDVAKTDEHSSTVTEFTWKGQATSGSGGPRLPAPTSFNVEQYRTARVTPSPDL